MPRASLSTPFDDANRTRCIACADAALFLDLDGTLAAIEATPDTVGPEARRNDLLREATVLLAGRLAVVSGRSLEEIDRIVEAAAPCAAGIHGLERRDRQGLVTRADQHGSLEEALVTLRALAASTPGLLVEAKTLSVALHYRGAPGEQAAACELARRLAQSTGLVLQEGRQVVELRTPGPNKGDAVRAFMAEAPFVGHCPIFVGDDVTDEDAFEAVNEFGGLGVLVGPPRRTGAQARLQGTEAVLDWIEASLTDGEFKVELLAR
jgi:trehalose 6-phosphate phosphatase